MLGLVAVVAAVTAAIAAEVPPPASITVGARNAPPPKAGLLLWRPGGVQQ